MNEIVNIVVAAVVGGVVTAIGFMYRERVTRKKESAGRRRAADIATLNGMRKMLSEATVKGLSEIEPYSGFPKSLVVTFEGFLEEFGRRQVVFHDRALNSLAHEGITAIQAFDDGSMKYCVPVGDKYATCPEGHDPKDKKRYAAEAVEVYKLARKVHDSFLALYDQARTRLEV